MKIGPGLAIGAPEVLLTWARLADDGAFSTLGPLDRFVYDNPEPLVTLAAIAGATTRIRVQTEVLLAPLREPALQRIARYGDGLLCAAAPSWAGGWCRRCGGSGPRPVATANPGLSASSTSQLALSPLWTNRGPRCWRTTPSRASSCNATPKR